MIPDEYLNRTEVALESSDAVFAHCTSIPCVAPGCFVLKYNFWPKKSLNALKCGLSMLLTRWFNLPEGENHAVEIFIQTDPLREGAIRDPSSLNQCNASLVYLGTLTTFIQSILKSTWIILRVYMTQVKEIRNVQLRGAHSWTTIAAALLEEVRKAVKLRMGNLRCFRLPPDADRFPVLTAVRSNFLSSRACIFWKITLKAFCISLSKSIFFARRSGPDKCWLWERF